MIGVTTRAALTQGNVAGSFFAFGIGFAGDVDVFEVGLAEEGVEERCEG